MPLDFYTKQIFFNDSSKNNIDTSDTLEKLENSNFISFQDDVDEYDFVVVVDVY